MVRRETDKTASDIQARSLMARTGEEWQGMQSLRRSINGQLKNQSSIMQEDDEESISLTLGTWSSSKSLRMQEDNWKHQWLQPCLARHPRKTSMERPVARLVFSSLNLRVSWKPTRMRMEESLPKYHEDHNARKGDNQFTATKPFGAQIYSYASSNEDTRSKSSSGQGMGET